MSNQECRQEIYNYIERETSNRILQLILNFIRKMCS